MNTRAKKTLRNLGVLCCGMCTLLVLVACEPNLSAPPADASASVVELPMRFTFGSDELSCDSSITVGDESWRINHLAFFVSELSVKTAANDNWQPLSFVTSDWQTKETSLLWFQNACSNKGSAPSNPLLRIDNSDDLWQQAIQVKFALAIPFTTNHQNPLTQPSPLNISEMFWSWRLGHKFLRLDMQLDSDSQQKSWSYHLGSVGCQSASSMRSPVEPCSMPNRFEMVLPRDSRQNDLMFDLSALLKDVDPSSMRSCMFHRAEELACDRLAENLQRGRVFNFAATTGDK